MVVTGIFSTGAREIAPRRSMGKASFGVRAERAVAEEPAVASAAVSAVSLLAVQEAETYERQDRQAQRHGEQVVDALADLQDELLGGRGCDIERLARLVTRPVHAADPALAAVLRAIQVRAAVELARREPQVVEKRNFPVESHEK